MAETLTLKTVRVAIPDGTNVIFGQSHFIKTVEDLYEALISASTSLKFGIAFCEASGKRLIRSDGNSPELIRQAETIGYRGRLRAHVLYLHEGRISGQYSQPGQRSSGSVPGLLRDRQSASGDCAESEQGRGVMGVIDGETPLGIETEADKKERVEFLRKIGYKRG